MRPSPFSRPFLGALLSLLASTCCAQHEYDNWYFGDHAALRFVGGTPTAVSTSAMNVSEGCSSISNAAGQLLFYTDGRSVYDRNNNVMPNGTGLLADQSTTQGALIVQHPGSAGRYFIFTVPSEGSGCNCMCYSIVDMTLNGGLGDVTSTKNVQIASDISEKLTAARAANGVDAWIVAHSRSNDQFYVFHLTTGGMVAAPVISALGSPYVWYNSNSLGQMKISPQGDRLACALEGAGGVELFDFNNSTGVISNARASSGYYEGGSGNYVYGLEFSGDGTKLYLSSFAISSNTGRLYQFDLSAGTPAAVWASATEIAPPSTHWHSLQRAPNGKIYAARWTEPTLDVINAPNASGVACGFQAGAVTLSGGAGLIGLPQALAGFVTPLPIELASFQADCAAGGVKVDWTTATERDNDHFVVERSTDGTTWEVATTVAGAGNSAHELHYAWVDEGAGGRAYYRLRQVDVDGTSSLSDVAVTDCAKRSGDLDLRPGDGPNSLVVGLPDGAFERLEVFAADGRVVSARLLTPDQRTYVVDLPAISGGVYLVRVTSANKALVKRWSSAVR